MPKIRTRQPNSLWLRQRELGIRFPLGHADRFHKTLYSSIQPVTSWDHALSPATHGGVFNLEYSPDELVLYQLFSFKFSLLFVHTLRQNIYSQYCVLATIGVVTFWIFNSLLEEFNKNYIILLLFYSSLLLAACERKTILMFDPLRRRLIHAIENAHDDCVNCVRCVEFIYSRYLCMYQILIILFDRFLDQRMFATCSDDSTAALWDARNLKQRIRTLNGHTNWVKNIEYSPKDSLLLTSGFDGSIYTWDINTFTENSILHTRVFHTNGLMRTRLSPDASKMLISTTSGYLIIIHNLRLKTLSQDLAGFRVC